MDSSNVSNNFSFLLVSEYVRCMQKQFEGKNDEELHVESQIFKLGLKPGFAFAAQLCYDGDNVSSPSEAAKFLATVLSPKIFNQKPSYKFTDQVMEIQFKNLPIHIKSLTSPDGSFTPEQRFWYRCHTSFMCGVYSGALSHFGFKVRALSDHLACQSNSNNELVFKFVIEQLEGAWTFCSTMKF